MIFRLCDKFSLVVVSMLIINEPLEHDVQFCTKRDHNPWNILCMTIIFKSTNMAMEQNFVALSGKLTHTNLQLSDRFFIKVK